jgi:hypothetical protein
MRSRRVCAQLLAKRSWARRRAGRPGRVEFSHACGETSMKSPGAGMKRPQLPHSNAEQFGLLRPARVGATSCIDNDDRGGTSARPQQWSADSSLFRWAGGFFDYVKDGRFCMAWPVDVGNGTILQPFPHLAAYTSGRDGSGQAWSSGLHNTS